jgi:hypothetical protein
MAKRVLHKPPSVQQGVGYKCWAAALSSWLVVTAGRPQWTQDQLLAYSKWFHGPRDAALPDGAINADIFKRMAVDEGLQLNMSCEEFLANDIVADDYMYQTLAASGHLFVVYTVSPSLGNVRHAVIVWGSDDNGNNVVMNPQVGAYQNKPTIDLYVPMLVAYNATPR